ncbi:general odorant-binding protein 56h-like [Zeugodacus cucurbitae]|uniref:general odorant-binding protein 56h-like n=1 Tax=Zeugodacus cucurbitae TaxID=28588 RepID=UPI0023D8FE18|nr:general odorant-binding protein 56h-like [Zeugodacus cucurbitae]
MKALIILFILAAFDSYTVSTAREAIEQIEMLCMFETNVTESELRKFLTNGIKASEANLKLKCMMKCMMEKQGMFNNGVYNATRAIQEMTSLPEMKGREDDIKKSVNGCKTEKGVNECDTAFKITMCLLEFKSRKHSS